MHLTLSPQLDTLVEEVRAWSVAEVRPHAREADRTHTVPPAIWKAYESAPFTGDVMAGRIEVDPARGIPEGQYVIATAVNEAAAYGDPIWVMANKGIGGKVISLVGTPEQVERWCGGLLRGEFRYTGFGLSEPSSGSDAAGLRTTARRDGDNWVINGSKMFISGGAIADFVVVFATLDRELGHQGIRAFVVEKGTPGFTVGRANESKLGIRALMTSELLFRDVVVPADHCLGTEEMQPHTFRNALTTLNTTRHQVAATSLGIARASLDEGVRLLRSVRGGFSTDRWTRVEAEVDAMSSAIDVAHTLCLRAAWLLDTGQPFGREASMAKAYAPPLAEKVILRVLELLGPIGWSEENLIEKWYRDIKIYDIWEGTGQIQRQTVSRYLFAATR